MTIRHPPDLEIVPESALPDELDRAIREGLRRCFPQDVEVFSRTRAWHGSSPAWSVVCRVDDRVAAHVGIVDRLIRAAGLPVRVAGVQNVFVLPEHRGKGLCDRVMNAAMAEARCRGFDSGLLYCVPDLEKVYSRCGWKVLRDAVILRVTEDGTELPLPAKNIVMFHPLRLTVFPPGTINLQGNDW